MIRQIGLMDYDTLRTKLYLVPNYDLGLVYAYLKNDKNINVRLISSPTPKNLSQYDKIYVFKKSPFIPHPSGYIEGYYKLPIEEYGPGFMDKPLRPFLLETKDMLPDFSCYNNMILFSMNKPHSRIAWKIDKRAKGGKYKPIRLYEDFEGEDLKKDYPQSKYCLIYDDPVDIINNKEKWEYFNRLIGLKHRFFFAQSLDISRITNTNILERVMKEPKYACLRKRLEATEINDNVESFIAKIMEGEYKRIGRIYVKLPVDKSAEICFEIMLLMNYYNHKTHFKVNLRPMWEKGYLETHDLALLAYRYLIGKPQYMSYYEYVFNISYLRKGVQKELIHTGEEKYEYIFDHYGMSPLLVILEGWLKSHPQFEEAIFIGGSSNYEKQRRKAYEFRGSGFDIRRSVQDSSSECSS